MVLCHFPSLLFPTSHTFLHNLTRDACARVQVQTFVKKDAVPLAAIVLAGSGPLKADLRAAVSSRSVLIRDKLTLCEPIDISGGGTPGLHEAIAKATPFLQTMRLADERKALSELFRCLSDGAGDGAVIGIKETVRALELGAVKTLVLDQVMTHIPLPSFG